MSLILPDTLDFTAQTGPEPSIELEWFGSSTYRLSITPHEQKKIVIFLDTHLERPSSQKSYMKFSDVVACDYIIISHAHFDHMPGADIIAKKTGAKIIANTEATNIYRKIGVPDEQLITIAGGETIDIGHGIHIRPYPALHALPWWDLSSLVHGPLPGPEVSITGGLGTCTMHITKGLSTYFAHLRDQENPQGIYMQAMKDFLNNQNYCHSWFDGGQIMYNIVMPTPSGARSILFSSHSGCWDGILKSLQVKPTVAILGVAGRPNLNGDPFQGSMAEFILEEVRWLQNPKKIIWTLHDQSPLSDVAYDIAPVTDLVEASTPSKVMNMTPALSYKINLL